MSLGLGAASLALSVLGTVGSAVGSSISNKKRDNRLSARENESNAWYQAELNKNPLQRSENIALLKRLDERTRENARIAANKAKVTGQAGMAQNAQTLAMKSANKAYSDAITGMHANESYRKDRLNSAWRKERLGFDNERENIENQKAENWGRLAENAVNLGSSAISSFAGSANTEQTGNGTGTGTGKTITV